MTINLIFHLFMALEIYSFLLSEVFNFRIITLPPVIHLFQILFSPYPKQFLSRWFLLMVFCSGELWYSELISLFLQFRANNFPFDITSLLDLRRVADFPVCSAFYLFLRTEYIFFIILPKIKIQRTKINNLFIFNVHMCTYILLYMHDFLSNSWYWLSF